MSNEIVPKGEVKGEVESVDSPARPVFHRVPRVVTEVTPEEQVSFGKLWHIVRKRKWFLIGSVAVCFALSVAFTLISSRKYQSTSTIEFNKENTDALDLNDARTGDASSMDYVVTQQTQVDALKGGDLALQVIKQLNLESRPEFQKKQFIGDYFQSFPDERGLPIEKAPHRRAEVLKAFAKNLDVQIVPGTRMINVKFFSPDAQVASAVVNTLVNDYQEQYMRIRMSATSQVSSFLSGQLDDLKNQVEDAQERLVEFQKEAGILGADESHNIIMTRLETVDNQLVEAKANRIFAQAISQMAKSGDPEALSGLVGSLSASSSSTMLPSTLSLLETMRDEQAKLKAEYAEASMKYGSSYPKLIQMESQLQDLDDSINTQKALLSSRAENDYLAAQQVETGLRSSFDQAKADADQMNDKSVQYTILKHEAESNRDLYDELQKK